MILASADAHGATTSSLDSISVTSLGTSWHTLRVVMLGQDLHFFLDAQPEVFTHTAAPDRVQGRIGLCVGYANARAYWDDVVVRRYVSPEPVVTAAADESIACP
jgi:hypothetical protein